MNIVSHGKYFLRENTYIVFGKSCRIFVQNFNNIFQVIFE